MKTYEATVTYRGVNTYMVEANDPADAEEKAKARYENGEDGIQTGSEWEEVESVQVAEAPEFVVDAAKDPGNRFRFVMRETRFHDVVYEIEAKDYHEARAKAVSGEVAERRDLGTSDLGELEIVRDANPEE